MQVSIRALAIYFSTLAYVSVFSFENIRDIRSCPDVISFPILFKCPPTDLSLKVFPPLAERPNIFSLARNFVSRCNF